MRIKSVRFVDVEPTEVYDLEVPEYHNFAIDPGIFVHNSRIYNVDYEEVESWQRGIAKNAVFGLIYGESEQSFADEYLSGDLVKAREIFDSMFSGFPKIKEFIERAHNEYVEFNKVTILTQRYVNLIDPTIDYNTMLRRSQNYKIQALAEDIAGLILYYICEWLAKNNMKSKPFSFIHDSIEIDVHPSELFSLIDKTDYLFNIYPQEEFNVPVACDIPIGPSMGQELITSDYEFTKDHTDNCITLEGFEEDMDIMENIWRSVYRKVEVIKRYDDETKEVYEPWSQIFLPKKAKISIYSGTTRKEVKRRYHIIV